MPAWEPPYRGLRVLDISQGLAGPSCASILAQQGAEVIKVEPPAGDWGRGIGWGLEGKCGLFIAGNLGKRSIAIDATRPKGRELLARLAQGVDVVVESFRPGVAARLGLGYADLAARDPRLVYVSVNGYGQDGPYETRPGSDSVFQAMTGLMRVNRDASGTPRKVGVLVADICTGVYAAQATGAALYRRATTGKGGHVEASLLEATSAFQAMAVVEDEIAGGKTVQPVAVPAATYATADGYINVTALPDPMFAKLAQAIGRTDWAGDASLAKVAGRLERRGEIDAGLAALFATAPTAHWIELLSRHDVLCGAVNSYAEMRADPQVRHSRILTELDQAPYGRILVPRLPGVPPEAAAAIRPAPGIGEHSIEVLEGLGATGAEIAALIEEGIVLAG
jgi:crotonobetainyl-CoA:carnitine CoA-transferase CaiB-like acyl-CoA transferase